ncbi:oxygenase MpaB family protein [Conexibacter woesei]|uniref:oxygenase MpaB family protein n=1 Tax=Conexibacter woesei TaxID=191495 RepID=UPI00135F1AB4|nr:oxygenase MpaB family protein [Conexibacter woesei]
MEPARATERAGDDIRPAPLGPDSLTWELFGDLRALLMVGRAGILQNMHPAIAAGVEQHSDYDSNPWNRLLRSIEPILGVVYDGAQAPATGATVRDFHREIKGRDAHGARYHALQPDVYYWAHATFFESQIVIRELFGVPLTAGEQERLYDESIAWYAQYGLTMRPVPPDYASFRRYWDRTLADVLAQSEPVRWSLDPARRRDIPRPYEWIPRPLWRALRPLVMGGSMWVAAGTLPPLARERLGLAWTARDERRLRLLARVVRASFRLVPHDLRYMPRARRAWRRERRAGVAG